MPPDLISSPSSYEICEDLSLRRDVPDILREQARHQLHFHLKMAPMLFPSWSAKQLNFVPPSGWFQMNPSIVTFGDDLYCALRCVNYIVDYRGPSQVDGTPFFSRTFLLSIDSSTLSDTLVSEICLYPTADTFKPGVPSGFEDLRLISFRDSLWGVFTRCTQNHEGWPEQYMGSLRDPIKSPYLADLRRLMPPVRRRPEKNWMPFVTNIYGTRETLCFIYLCDPTIVLATEQKISETYPNISANNFRGSSQAIAFDSGWLALIHTLVMHRGFPKYSHRFIWLDADYRLTKISEAFTLPATFETDVQNGYQYIMGLTKRGSKLIVSYSLGDCQAWLATLDEYEVEENLRSV